MNAAQTCHVLRSLEIDHRVVRFEEAVAIVPPEEQGRRWSIVVFGLETGDSRPLPRKLQVVAITRGGLRLAGRAQTETASPQGRYLGLRGSGPLPRS